jgi:hypothetical protein
MGIASLKSTKFFLMLWVVADEVDINPVKRPTGLARGKGIPMKTKKGMSAIAEPRPPSPKTNETMKEIADISTKLQVIAPR